MPKNVNFDKIMPGVGLVPDSELEAFFKTEEGAAIKLILDGYVNKASTVRYTENAAERQRYANFSMEKARLEAKANPDLNALKKLIYQAMLKKWIATYLFVDSATQAILINKPYTAEFYQSYYESQQIKDCIERWESAFKSDMDAEAVKIRARQSEFVEDTKEKIGFLLTASVDSDNKMYNLLYAIALKLYYSKKMNEKKELLKQEFNKYLKRYDKYDTRYAVPEISFSFRAGISSLTHLAMQFRDVKETIKELDRISNVHLLFGILGLREPTGFMLESIDVYNYVALADDVSTLKTVIFAFARPLRSFFTEYVQIAKFEKNPVNFLFRATMPILIMTCFVAFAFSLMVPFAMHAIIEIIMLIPTLYISMVLASYYVDLKNRVFEAFLIYWYGSRYEQDAFKTNDRMIQGLAGNAGFAESVRNYYIRCFIECDAIVSALSKKFERGILNDEQIRYYEAMLNRQVLLKKEWYEIHDNTSLGVDNIKSLIERRFHQDAHDAYKTIYKFGNLYIDGLIEELEQHLKKSQNTVADPKMRWSMFKPTESLTHLAKKFVSQQETLELVEGLQPLIDECRPNVLSIC